MIVYSGIKSDFLAAVEADAIASEIEENIYKKCIKEQHPMSSVHGKIHWSICIRF